MENAWKKGRPFRRTWRFFGGIITMIISAAVVVTYVQNNMAKADSLPPSTRFLGAVLVFAGVVVILSAFFAVYLYFSSLERKPTPSQERATIPLSSPPSGLSTRVEIERLRDVLDSYKDGVLFVLNRMEQSKKDAEVRALKVEAEALIATARECLVREGHILGGGWEPRFSGVHPDVIRHVKPAEWSQDKFENVQAVRSKWQHLDDFYDQLHAML